ncbi:hypothetical protein J7F03_03355, partial [Streptomyces sp. ISL-43]|uniref:hypothetical protein n=1 Tax=Streptomyces sp. ISL-43 TaxID=2819183 RepID=UPI001BEB213A
CGKAPHLMVRGFSAFWAKNPWPVVKRSRTLSGMDADPIEPARRIAHDRFPDALVEGRIVGALHPHPRRPPQALRRHQRVGESRDPAALAA